MIMNKSLTYSVILFLSGVFLLNIMGLLIKHLELTYSPYQISVYRNIFGIIPIIIILFFSSEWKKNNYQIMIPKLWVAYFRGACITFAQICFFTSLIYLEFATATALSFATPIVVTILSIPILKQSIGVWRWFAVFIGFIGVFLIIDPSDDFFSYYSLLPLGAALGYGMSMVLVKVFPNKTLSALIQGQSQIASLFFSLILLYLSSQYVEIENTTDLILFILMGSLGGLGVFLIIAAYRKTKPINVAPFEYFGILFAFALGWIVFDEAPFEKLFPGVIGIIAAGLIIFWRERKRESTQ